MGAFISSVLAIYIIVVMKVLAINFTFDLLLDLRSTETTYLHNVPTMMTLLLSLIFLTPKVMMSVEILHLS